MTKPEQSGDEPRSGFDVLRLRITDEYDANVKIAVGTGSIDALAGLQSLRRTVLSEIDEAEQIFRDFYTSSGRAIADELVLAAIESGLPVTDIIKQVNIQVNGGISLSEILDPCFSQTEADEVLVVTQADAEIIATNGLSHRVAEYLDIE